MIKKRSDNCEYCTQTSPNQPKPIGMINSDKNLPILTFDGTGQEVRILVDRMSRF